MNSPRTGNYRDRSRMSETRFSLNVMVLALGVFVMIAVLALLAGSFPVRPTPAPTTGTTYREINGAAFDRLDTYGWIDPSQGQVHIPIDQAFDLLIERGVPTRANGDGE